MNRSLWVAAACYVALSVSGGGGCPERGGNEPRSFLLGPARSSAWRYLHRPGHGSSSVSAAAQTNTHKTDSAQVSVLDKTGTVKPLSATVGSNLAAAAISSAATSSSPTWP